MVKSLVSQKLWFSIPVWAFASFFLSFEGSGEAAEPSVISSASCTQGWIALFNGVDLFGWEVKEGQGSLSSVHSGGLILSSSVELGPTELTTVAPWGDYDLLIGAAVSSPSKECRAVLELDSDLTESEESGSLTLLFSNGATSSMTSEIGEASSTHDLKAMTPPMTSLIQVRGEHVAVIVAGEKVQEVTLSHQSSNQLRLVSLVAESDIRISSLWARPHGLNQLFNESDLSGWHIRKEVRPDRPGIDVRVEEGVIRIQGGPGYLESDNEFADFHARFRIRVEQNTNGGSKSGVYFRATRYPGENFVDWPLGIKVQVLNQQEDYSTGGLEGRYPAHDLYSEDGEWFWLDICARGPQIRTWVHGMPTTVYTDTKGEYQSGVIALQGWDAKNLVYYGAVEIAELP